MAIIKNAYIRFQILDKCFRNTGRKYSIDLLLDEINKVIIEMNPDSEGIKKRQLYDDIKFMESEEGFQVEFKANFKDGKIRYYRYEDPNFSITNSAIKPQEAEQIKSALMVLDRFKGLPQFEWVQELIPKLETSFGFKSSNQEIISFEENKDLTGLNFLGDLFNAIHYKKTITITYKPFNSENASIQVVSPYYLKQFNLRWFLFAKNAQYETISNFALDRIVSIEESNDTYIETKINFAEYFEDIIGVTKPIDVDATDIQLFFDKKLAPYIITKPIHESQKVKQVENGIIVKINVIPNFELEKLILSHGEGCKVISPESLVLKLKERVKSMMENYG
jgi:predicted DNA-binding transcriptional regulator YafY